jgi:Tol biopolymer transport system component
MRNQCYLIVFPVTFVLAWASCSSQSVFGADLNERQTRILASLNAIGFQCDGEPIAKRSEVFLSPGGKGFAYVTSDPKGSIVIANGVSFGPYPAVDGPVMISEDGSKTAFVILHDLDKPQSRTLVIDGKEVATHDNLRQIVLSYDAKRYAFLASDGTATVQSTSPTRRGGRRMSDGFEHLYVDGQEVGCYRTFVEIGFSRNGKSAVWVAAEQEPTLANSPGGIDVWVRGEKFPAHFCRCGPSLSSHDGASSLAISPDGNRWAVRGQVFAPPSAGDVGGYAVMVDGKMQPTFVDVVDGTVRFTTDSKEVLYAAGHAARGNYSVYRNGKPGKTWNYIRPRSLRSVNGGKSVAFTGYQGPPGNFMAFGPVPSSDTWSPGTPALVIDDTVVLPNSQNWVISEDGRHFLAVEMTKTGLPPGQGAIIYDHKKVAAVPEYALWIDLKLSPGGKHWLAVIKDNVQAIQELIADGVKHKWPPESDIREIGIDDTGAVKMVVGFGGSVWRGTITATAQQPAAGRTWTDSTGTHHVDAEFVKLDNDIVRLKKGDGTIIKIPLDKLSAQDKEFVRQQTNGASPAASMRNTGATAKIPASDTTHGLGKVDGPNAGAEPGSSGFSRERPAEPAQNGKGQIQLVTKEASLGKFHPGALIDTATTSPDSRRVIYFAREGEMPDRHSAGNLRYICVVDGVAGPAYNGRIDYAWFSPDSKRVAYHASVYAGEFFVIDGREEEKFRTLDAGSFVFSPDSKRFAYEAHAITGQFNNIPIELLVVDGKKVKECQRLEHPIFSPDSKRFACLECSDMSEKSSLIVEGARGNKYDSIVPYNGSGSGGVVFSPDGKRIAQFARRGEHWFVVVDGKETNECDGVQWGSLTFSPDSKRLAYWAKQGNSWIAIIDGKEGKEFTSPTGETVAFRPDGKHTAIIFSPDSKHAAYVAGSGLKLSVVIDGVLDGKNTWTSGLISGIATARSLMFSPDSTQIAYCASKDGKHSFVVVNGKQGKTYDQIVEDTLIFSPDSKHIAYWAKQGEAWSVVVDGKEGPSYEAWDYNPEKGKYIRATPPVFSPDGRHVAYLANRGNKRYIVVDGVESQPYDGIPTYCKCVFDDAQSLHAIAHRGGEFFRVDVQITEK